MITIKQQYKIRKLFKKLQLWTMKRIISIINGYTVYRETYEPLGCTHRLRKGYQIINVRVRVGFLMEALLEKIPKIDDRIRSKSEFNTNTLYIETTSHTGKFKKLILFFHLFFYFLTIKNSILKTVNYLRIKNLNSKIHYKYCN